jgi:FkbM family methyltransferase
MSIKHRFRDLLSGGYRKSYAQAGEDILMAEALKSLKINKPSYIDIGTNTPISKNNTYLFYSNGSRGVCIEPDPELFKQIKSARKRDTVLNVGIGPSENSTADYYVLSSKMLSTFSKDEAEKIIREQKYGRQKIEKVIKIPLVPINSIMVTHFPSGLDILSIDTEGYDFDIIKSLDLNRYRPKIICAETLRYNAEGKLEKEAEIIDYLKEKAYFLYADTYINSIFVDSRGTK